ncbi:MAG: hypothetical protein OXH01_06730, partial [Bacteroidetes bacterium]|nr:hypothetical protein [Bacteroidota bacterium]
WGGTGRWAALRRTGGGSGVARSLAGCPQRAGRPGAGCSVDGPGRSRRRRQWVVRCPEPPVGRGHRWCGSVVGAGVAQRGHGHRWGGGGTGGVRRPPVRGRAADPLCRGRPGGWCWLAPAAGYTLVIPQGWCGDGGG